MTSRRIAPPANEAFGGVRPANEGQRAANDVAPVSVAPRSLARARLESPRSEAPNSVRLARAVSGLRRAAAVANGVHTASWIDGPGGGDSGPPSAASATVAAAEDEAPEGAYDYFARCVATLEGG